VAALFVCFVSLSALFVCWKQGRDGEELTGSEECMKRERGGEGGRQSVKKIETKRRLGVSSQMQSKEVHA